MSKIADIKEGIANGFLAKHYGSLDSIGILLDKPNNNQAYFYSSYKSPLFINKHPYLEIALYFVEMPRPKFFPMLPMFQMSELKDFGGHYIATSYKTVTSILNMRLANKYFYVYNLLELFHVPQDVIQEIKKSGIKIFTRNDDYAKILENHFNLTIESVRVPDFNMDRIMNITGIR